MPRKVNRKRKEKTLQLNCYCGYCDGEDDAVFKPCSSPASPPPEKNNSIINNTYIFLFTVIAIDVLVTYIKPYFNKAIDK
jgi:hypothetical protein